MDAWMNVDKQFHCLLPWDNFCSKSLFELHICLIHVSFSWLYNWRGKLKQVLKTALNYILLYYVTWDLWDQQLSSYQYISIFLRSFQLTLQTMQIRQQVRTMWPDSAHMFHDCPGSSGKGLLLPLTSQGSLWFEQQNTQRLAKTFPLGCSSSALPSDIPIIPSVCSFVWKLIASSLQAAARTATLQAGNKGNSAFCMNLQSELLVRICLRVSSWSNHCLRANVTRAGTATSTGG